MGCTHDPPFFGTFSFPDHRCIECLIQERIAAVEEIQDILRDAGGIFKVAERAHRSGRRSSAMEFRCETRWRWVITKLQLLTAVTDIEIVMEIGSQSERAKCRRALEVYEAAIERLAELPGMDEPNGMGEDDGEEVDEAMSQVGIENCVEEPSEDDEDVPREQGEDDTEDAASLPDETPVKVAVKEPTSSSSDDSCSTKSVLAHDITKPTLSMKAKENTPTNKRPRTLRFSSECEVFPCGIPDGNDGIDNTKIPRTQPHNMHTSSERHRWRMKQCLYLRVSGGRRYWYYRPGVWASPKGYQKADTSMATMRWREIVAMERKEKPSFRLRVPCEGDEDPCAEDGGDDGDDGDGSGEDEGRSKAKRGRGLMGLMSWGRSK